MDRHYIFKLFISIASNAIISMEKVLIDTKVGEDRKNAVRVTLYIFEMCCYQEWLKSDLTIQTESSNRIQILERNANLMSSFNYKLKFGMNLFPWER